MANTFYLTTTLPYVNSDPHIGFALEIIQADARVRFERLRGREVFYNTGTDEHGLKIFRKAVEKGVTPQEYCDEYAAKFRSLVELLNLDNPTFIRTTDEKHVAAAQEFWRRCEQKGDIYKKKYQVKYCVGCEMEKTDSELVEGACPLHPTTPIEHIEEDNYFFRFSAYSERLIELYEKTPDFVVPENRLLEIKEFVKRGLEDFSVSRLKEKMPWGVPVPGDDTQVMYVWFDALVNYISTLDWPDDEAKFRSFWYFDGESSAYQVAGKDNLRQQSAMWQAMLMSADLPTTRQIFIHGFITSGGQKMSKSLGNVIAPHDLLAFSGADALRFFLLGLPSYEDGDVTVERFREIYTSSLANGLGNLSARIFAMTEKYTDTKVPNPSGEYQELEEFFRAWWPKYFSCFPRWRFDEVIAMVNEAVSRLDQEITTVKPWEKVKKGESVDGILYALLESLRQIALSLLPISPVSARTILLSLGLDERDFSLEKDYIEKKLISGSALILPPILFPRLEK